jgi:hypothetical protein
VLRRLGVERLSAALSKDLAILIAKITAGDSISAQSIRAILADANEAIPEPNATPEAWNQWLAHTSSSALGNALVELSSKDNEYGATVEVADWIRRHFREVAAAPEAPSPATASSAKLST